MKELPRRLWHILGGLSVPVSGLWAPREIFLPSLISITLAAIGLEVVRHHSPEVNRRFLYIFRELLRESENSTLTASTYFLIASSTVFALCDKSVAALALVFVSVGDPVAGMVGERWGKIWLTWQGSSRHPAGLRLRSGHFSEVKGKSLEGSLGCLVTCLIAGFIVAAITDLTFWLVVVGAFCATMVEFLSFRVNDNLSIPLMAAGVMSLIQYLAA